jgi:MATE family multidrug resistance protein
MPPKRSPGRSPRTQFERSTSADEEHRELQQVIETEQSDAEGGGDGQQESLLDPPESGLHRSGEEGEQEALLPADSKSRPAAASAEYSDDSGTTVRSEQLKIFSLAWPVGATFILQSSAQQMTIIFVGQLGALELGAASMANMWINITGMSIIYGGMSAYDTLGSQAFGARNYELVGLLAQRCLAICTLLCLPIAISWWFLTGPVLMLVGIEQDTAELAQLFARTNILTLWPTLAHNVLQRFLRSQGIVRPVTLTMGVLSVLFGPIAWLLVDRFGFVGAPLANALLNFLILFVLLGLVRCRGYADRCWNGWSSKALSDWAIIIKLGSAGVMGNMGQWWSWEIAAGMAGNLGQVSLAAHSVLQNVGFFMFPLTFGLSTATTVRVGTLLGAGRGTLAKTTSRAAVTNAGVLCLIITGGLTMLRNVYPRLYSPDSRVVSMASSLTTVYAVYQVCPKHIQLL